MALFLGEAAAAPDADSPAAKRALYAEALDAAKSRDWPQFKQLRSRLDDYPLALYLDYKHLEGRLDDVEAGEAKAFVDASVGTPLHLRFKALYLRDSGRNQRWQNFLALSPTSPVSVDLQCYYYRARLSRGDKSLAWEGARALWLHGKSRPKACDPLFDEWIDADQLDDETVWQRKLLAFKARQLSLMRYAGRKASERQAPFSDALISVYRHPANISLLKLPTKDPRSLDVLAYGISRLARVDAVNALPHWKRLQEKWAFTTEQRQLAGDAIVRYTLREQVKANFSWLDGYLAQRGDMGLLEARLRLAIRSSDWRGILRLSELLSTERRDKSVWRYWNAIALEKTGDGESARPLLESLAGKRAYYGFLAAEKLGREYNLNHQPLQIPQTVDSKVFMGAVARTRELLHHQSLQDARSEWKYLLNRVDHETRTVLAGHADSQGWSWFAIEAAVKASQWDALAVRFPQPHLDVFRKYGKRYGVTDIELISIARRESAFFQRARSGTGARGLMQLMPTTARRTARALGQHALAGDLYQVEANIALGGAYYQRLLDEHKGNRVLSLAAYNAGPQRVRQWLRKTGKKLDVYQWVETIPYRETREYVQAVLAYNVVYDRLRNGRRPMLRSVEINRKY